MINNKSAQKTLNKVLFFALVGVVLAGFSFAQTSTPSKAEVLGTVYNCGVRVPYANVSATCGTQTLSGQTGSTGGDLGKYSLTFYNSSCVNGSTVNVTANVDGNNYSNSGVIGTYFWFSDIAKVEIETGSNCPAPEVPEFGLITGSVAGLVSLGTYLALRKRTHKLS